MFVANREALLNVLAFGRGPMTFVAHGGWVGSWELWQEPFQLMQSRWRCVSYDHRGSGATTAPPESISPSALVDDLFVVLDELGVDECVLAGESMGAMTCLAAVERDPSRFRGLVLVDPVPSAGPDAHPMAEASRRDFSATVREFVDACIPEPDSDHLRRWGRQILLRAEPEAAARIIETFARECVAPDLRRISVPTLVVHGANDVIVPLEVAEEVTATIPDAHLTVIDGAGHVPTMTRPHEVVAAIEAWWDSQQT